MKSEMVIFDGGAVKALGDGKVGGYGVYFTNETQPDLDGDFFTKDTDFDLEDKLSLPVYFAHGVDAQMKKRKLSRASFKMTDEGLWVETQLDLRDRWLAKIHELIAAGKLSFSSAAISHLVERVKKASANWIATWPLIEVSFTASPAAPYGTEVQALKSYEGLSLKEMVRRSKLSEGELLREEGMRMCEHAEAVLAWVDGGPKPSSVDEWASDQVMRGADYLQRRAAQQDYIAMRAEAKARLAKIDDLAKEYEQLIGAVKTEKQKEDDHYNRLVLHWAGNKYSSMEIRKGMGW